MALLSTPGTGDATGAGLVRVGDLQLEVRRFGPSPEQAPTLLLLHEGLGSAAMLGRFPERLVAATGCGVVAYSRAGYGASSPVSLPRPLSYMHDEARDVLPGLLAALGLRRGVLIGHSDGASIAALYAACRDDPRLAGLVLIAPHFFVEEVTLASIAAAREAYATTDLRARLARWHTHVDVAFRGWCDAWLDPAFARWDIRDRLPRIRVPVCLIQGSDDQYGTLAQVAAAEQACTCPLTTHILPGVSHAPHREDEDATLQAIADFVRGIPVEV